MVTYKVEGQSGPTEAPTGFDNLTNGLVSQEVFDSDRDTFAEQEFIADGLGPVYNAQSCGECHQNPVTGAISQITELRAGRFDGLNFTEAAGGSLINDRAIHASIQERVADSENVRTFRTSLNTLGDGFVEAIADNTLIAIAQQQPIQSLGFISGQVIAVPVLEANNALRVARFGWKNQHASLVSFAADAYLNEMGITTPLQPVENTSKGNSVAAFDNVADPEDDGEDVLIFARFMRATKAPSRDTQLAATPEAQAGSRIFDQIGCNVCHVRNITTAPVGTVINGGQFRVPPALGNKIIHPFGDFLLHDIGTGDGIVQNGGNSTRNKMRTAPLWGVRTRNRLMHDGESLTFNDAILRHRGEATAVTVLYLTLSQTQKNQLAAFLRSL
ncbi:MAG: hypothetical protein HY819_25010 [Acidobacteria bacterium]|nr:hypothetical protein [Acidobacteriota bacterium]